MHPLPTPTPIQANPEIEAQLNLEGLENISLWDFTDEAIQIWNTAPEITSLLQAITLIMIIGSGAFIIVSIIRNLVTD